MSFFLKFYSRALNKYPMAVQSVQTGLLMGTGDFVAQKWIEKRTSETIDWKRMARFSAVGFIVVGPGLRVWYSFMNKHLGSSGKAAAIKKVLADQFCFAPGFLFFLVGTLSYLQTHDLKITQIEMEKNYLDILKTNYYIWPWVQLFNFYIVPFKYQVLLVQVVAVVWNTYLSWKTNDVEKVPISKSVAQYTT